MLCYLLFFFFFANSEPWRQAGFDSHGSYRSNYKRTGSNEWIIKGEKKTGFSYPTQAVIDDKTSSLLVTYTDYYNFPANVSTYLLQIDLEDGSIKSRLLLTDDPIRKPYGVPVVAQVSGVDDSIYILSGWTKDDPSESVPIYLGFKVSDSDLELDWKVNLGVDIDSILWNNVVTGDGILLAEPEEEFNRNQVFGIQYPQTSYNWKIGWIMINRYLSLDADEYAYFFNTSSFVKIDPKSGEILVNKTIDIGEYGIVDGSDRVVFADKLGLCYMIGESNLARCHDTKTLSQQWETELTTDVGVKCSNPAVTNDEKYLIFVCSGFNTGNSSVYVLDTVSGSIQYSYSDIGEKNCIILGNQGIGVFSDPKNTKFAVTCQKNLYIFGPDYDSSSPDQVKVIDDDDNGSSSFITSVVLDDSDSIYVCFVQTGTFNCRRILPS